MMQNVQPSSPTLQQLLHDLDEGNIQLPDFQRDFKWKVAQAKALLETIQQNHPAGALLFLKTPAEGSPFGEVPFKYATPPSPKRPEILVLDGQQRLTSCYVALYNKGEPRPRRDVSYFVDLRALYESQLKAGSNGEIDFASCIKTKPWDPNPNQFLQSESLLPFTLLRRGNSNKPREALNNAIIAYRDSIKETEESTPFYDFIDGGAYQGYLDTFFTYSFPVITLPSNLSVTAVCKIFETINTRGLKLGAFDLTVASLRRQNRNLKQLWDAARQDNLVKILDKDGTNTLQTVALLAGTSSKKAELPKTLSAVHMDAHWQDAVDAIRLAGEFISQHGGGNPPRRDYIPYDGIVPALATILKKLSAQKLSDPASTHARRVVARWYFTSALGQRYNEGTDVLQERDVKQVLPHALRLRSAVATDGLDVTGWSPHLWAAAAPSGAIGRALKCMLHYASPKDPLSPGLLGAGGAPTQLHHIFPRGYMKSKGEDKRVNSFLNQTFLSPATNRLVGKNAPSRYIPELLKEIAKKGSSLQSAEATLRSNLEAHFIDDNAYTALHADDFEAFIKARAYAFAAAFQRQFDVQLKDLSGDAAAEEQALAVAEDESIGVDEEYEEEMGLRESSEKYDAA